jgi:hypothetical protein
MADSGNTEDYVIKADPTPPKTKFKDKPDNNELSTMPAELKLTNQIRERAKVIVQLNNVTVELVNKDKGITALNNQLKVALHNVSQIQNYRFEKKTQYIVYVKKPIQMNIKIYSIKY